MIRNMQHRGTLLLLLFVLSAIGLATVQLALSPDLSPTARFLWLCALVALPLALGSGVWMGWTWTPMACVIYGTIGLALDLATVTSILGGYGGTGKMLALSGISGIVNFSLIVFGGRAFWSCLQGPPPPGSRPPNPPSPVSSSAS
jgi:hypothetical protein